MKAMNESEHDFLGLQKRHWLLLLIVLAVFVLPAIIFVSKGAFAEGRRFANQDPQVFALVGPISEVGTGMLKDWTVKARSEDIVFDVKSQNQSAALEVHLYRSAGVWKESAAYLNFKHTGKIVTLTLAGQ